MSLPEKVSQYNRKRKWGHFTENILFNESTKLLDVGFNDIEFSNVDNYLEKNYPYQNNITALGIIGKKNFQKRYPLVNVVLYDGKNFPFDNNSFNVCWSNAVIEHVGTFEEQLHFIKEMFRVSKQVFFTTPNRYFPLEVHTRTPILHIISKKMFDKYLVLVGKKWATGNYMNLLTEKQIIALLQAANIHNYKIIRNRLFGFTLDFVVIINDLKSV
jgi:SAM-dependent methyltransferase